VTWPTWSTGAWAAARLPRSSVRPGREARTDSLGLFVLDRPRLSKRRLSILDRPGLPCLPRCRGYQCKPQCKPLHAV